MENLNQIVAEVKSAADAVNTMKAANETAIAEVKGQVAEVKSTLVTMDEAAKANQKALDELIAAKNAKSIEAKSKKSFGDAFADAMAEAFESKQAEFKNFQKDRNAKFTLELKEVGTMTVGNNLTGDGVATYNTRQGLVPAQKINFRDLVPTTQSPTGLYVTYRETGTEGALTVQTEGNSKGQIDYAKGETLDV